MFDLVSECSRQDKASGSEPSKAAEERQARNEDSEVRKKEKGVRATHVRGAAYDLLAPEV